MTPKQRKELIWRIGDDFDRYFQIDLANEIAERQNALDAVYRTVAGPWVLNEVLFRAALDQSRNKNGDIPVVAIVIKQ
jgi:hypothetical protein